MKFIIAWLLLLIVACSPDLNSRSKLPQSTYAKSGAQVTLVDIKPILVIPNVATTVPILLSSVLNEGNMYVEVSASQEILIHSSQSFDFQLSSAAHYKIPLEVTVTGPGRHYVNLHITTVNGAKAATRALAVIVQAGESHVTTKKQATDATGVISLPAQETLVLP